MKTYYRDIIAPAILVAMFCIVDLFIGYPLFGLLAIVCIILYTMIMSVSQLIGRRKVEWNKSILCYKNILAISLAVLSFGVYFINRWHVHKTKSEVLSAICGFRKEQGRLPEDLGDLVPKYLPRLPRPRLIGLGPSNEYRILSGGEGKNLLLIEEGHFDPESVMLDEKVCE